MKKNSISRFTVIIVTALFMLTSANAFAGRHVQPVKTTVKQTSKDDPYMAYVQINLSGRADTPYLSFSSQPDQVYSDVSSLLSRQPGLFHVLITFVNKVGETVGEDDYYVNDNDHPDAIKYD